MLKNLITIAFAVALCMVLIPDAYAQNAITPGALVLSATIDNLSVKAPYTGDANENATVVVQFKAQASMTWLTAYSAFIDRRPTLGGVTNPYYRQARVSIVGNADYAWSPVQDGTDYDVRAVWTDSDGGSATVTGTVSTYPFTPTVAAGSTCAATNDATLATCLAGTDPVITLAAATYTAFSASRSGAAGAYIKLDFAQGATCVSPTSASLQCIDVTGHHVWLKHPQCGEVYYSCVKQSSASVYITDIYSPDTDHGCATSPASSNHQNAAGIRFTGGSAPSEVFILGGTISSTQLLTAPCTLTPANASPANGIYMTGGAQNTVVIRGLTISGGFRDGIGTFGTAATLENSDVIGITCGQTKDDCIDWKGANINTRMAENKIEPGVNIGGANWGLTGIAPLTNTTSNAYGPCYIHHNYIHPLATASGGGTAYKAGGAECFYFNNTFDGSLKGTASSGRWSSMLCSPGGVQCSQTVSYNNINYSGGEAMSNWKESIVNGSTGAVTSLSAWDYDIQNTTGAGSYIKNWNGTTTYSSITAFATATGQEVHGYKANPGLTWTNGVGTITVTSPAYNTGVALTNFNSSDSAWPYAGSAPDIGAYELNAGCTPHHLTFISQPVGAVLDASIGPVSVGVYDSSNVLCNSATNAITLSKNGSATWGTLNSASLTVDAVSGVAAWTDLYVSGSAGAGSINAAASGLTGATSNSITITAPVYAYPSAQGWCSQGGVTVTTGGNSSTTTVQASYPTCNVQVNIAGAGAATIYSTATGTALGNPFTASAVGLWQFYASPGAYDVIVSGGTPSPGIVSPLTFPGVIIGGIVPTAYASLPTCSSTTEGLSRAVTDSSTAVWGAAVSGGGANHILAYCNGSAWTVRAK